MKKFLLLFSLILTATFFSANAQKIYFGIHGGLLKNAMVTEDYSPLPPYMAFSRGKVLLNTYTWGINLGYALSDHWAFETQLQFVNIRFKERVDLLYDFHNGPIAGSMLAEIDWYRNYAYLRVPVLCHYNILPAKSRFGIGLTAGPNLGFLTGQASDYAGVNELGIEKQHTLNFEDMPLRKIDLGFQLGLRVQSKLTQSLSLLIDGTVYQGFSNIINYPPPAYNRPTAYYDNMNVVNRHLAVTLGIQYNLSVDKPLWSRQ